MKVHYYATIKGITEQETEIPTVYYGKVLRIPREEFTGPDHVALEEATIKEIESGEWLPEGEEFPEDGIVERYEVFEPGTGDVLIMYRVPCQVVEADTDDSAIFFEGLPEDWVH